MKNDGKKMKKMKKMKKDETYMTLKYMTAMNGGTNERLLLIFM